MSMYRVRNNHKRWRLRWPWKRVFPLRVDSRFCPECELPHHDGPLPKELERFFVGNIAVLVFPGGSFLKDEVVLRVARYKAGGKQFYFSEFIPASDLDDLLTVIEMAKEKLPTRKTRAKR